MKPFFSIVVPTYNRSDVLSRPVDSVLNQTYQNFELIIIDNG
jgi:glycosyltransferase involved in cell wall biosynthesis